MLNPRCTILFAPQKNFYLFKDRLQRSFALGLFTSSLTSLCLPLISAGFYLSNFPTRLSDTVHCLRLEMPQWQNRSPRLRPRRVFPADLTSNYLISCQNLFGPLILLRGATVLCQSASNLPDLQSLISRSEHPALEKLHIMGIIFELMS